MPKKNTNGITVATAVAYLPLIIIVAIIVIPALGVLDDLHKSKQEVESLQARIATLEEALDAEVSSSKQRVKLLDEKLFKVENQVELTNERIEYYRDVLLIVSKTCPGRMKLPSLGGDPGAKR